MDLFTGLLKQVSRSIYLSLQVLPAPMRKQMGLGYLFCRAADTIADTRLIPRPQRLQYLDLFWEQFDDKTATPNFASQIQSVIQSPEGHPSEKLLLLRLDECFKWYQRFDGTDRQLLKEVVYGVIEGMRMDLRFFTGEDASGLVALATPKELETYCYFIGGCPGIFWTKLSLRHMRGLDPFTQGVMLKQATEFGKGLQMTNILRDLAKDLRNGRCYIPQAELNRQKLSPKDLLNTNTWPRLEPVYHSLIDQTRLYLDDGLAYIQGLPRLELRLRVACAWPLLASLKTLALLTRSHDVLDPHKTVKVTRNELYKMMAASTLAAPSNAALAYLYRQF